MSTHYKKFMRLLENWPVDTTKPRRDLGEYLRKQLKASLRAGDISLNGEVSLDRQFQALERLSNNIYFKRYPRTRESSSTGLNAEQCKIIISDTSMKYFAEQEKKSIFRNFFKKSDKSDKPSE